MTRNIVASETAELNRTERQGAFTFNAEIPDDYEGICFVVAAIRLGDHAHLDVSSGTCGRAEPDKNIRRVLQYGNAGKLIFAWHHWLLLRAMLDEHPTVLIREVENPTPGQVRFHT